MEEEAGEAWLGTLKRRYRGFKISLDSGLGAAAPAAPCTADGGSVAGGLTQWFLSNTTPPPTGGSVQVQGWAWLGLRLNSTFHKMISRLDGYQHLNT